MDAVLANASNLVASSEPRRTVYLYTYIVPLQRIIYNNKIPAGNAASRPAALCSPAPEDFVALALAPVDEAVELAVSFNVVLLVTV